MNKYILTLKELLIIDIKENLEYKASFYSHLISTLLYAILTLGLILILNQKFDDIFFFENKTQILFYVSASLFIQLIMGIFMWSKKLAVVLLRGELNLYLIRPINIFFLYFFHTMRTRRVISALIFLIIAITTIEKIDIKLAITFLILLLGSFLYLLIYLAIDSLGFYIKKVWTFKEAYQEINDTFRTFPILFENKSIFPIMFLVPTFYYAYLSTKFYFGFINIEDLLMPLKILLSLITLLILITYIMWHYGLKKYEAFG